jgi:hypothetical protein
MADDHDRTAAGTVPFWAHQLAEMLLGGLLLIEGARTGQHTVVLVSLGSALLLLSLLSDGALGAWPWIGRRLHRVLDFAAATVLALSPVLLALTSALPIVILEAAALGMVWLALRTNWAPKRIRTPVAPPPPRPAPTATPPTATTATTPTPPATPATPIARQVGSAVGKAKTDGPRQLGRAVGRARAKARARRAPPPDG